jgi:hypothetical protein
LQKFSPSFVIAGICRIVRDFVVAALDLEQRTIWIVDAHRDDGERFIARSDEKLTAFPELESAIRTAQVNL